MKFLRKEIKDIKPGDLLVENTREGSFAYVVISIVTADRSNFVMTYYGFNHSSHVHKIFRSHYGWWDEFDVIV